MQKNLWLNLQYFAEGASSGDGAGEGAGTGEMAVDAGQNDTLEAMGVPKALADKYRQRKGIAAAPQTAQNAAEAQTAIPEQQTATAEADADGEAEPAKASLKDALKSNPEWNKEMQEIISKRLKTTKAEQEQISQAIRLLASNYGIDAGDLKALNDAIVNDKRNYRKAAEDMGTDTDTAKRVWEKEDAADQVKAAARQNIEDMALREHFTKLQTQAEQLSAKYPGFDLNAELNNPAFVRMTSPEGGLSVEQAFHALHYAEIEQAQQRAAQQIRSQTAQQTAARVNTAISNSIQAGRAMPQENGSVNRAATNLQPKLYENMTSAEREQFKKLARSGHRF